MSRAFLPVVIILIALLGSYAVQRRTTNAFDYRCMNCGNVFSLSPFVAVVSPHRLRGRKFARCPLCGTRSWVTRVPKI